MKRYGVEGGKGQGGAHMPLGITLSDVERSQLQLYFSQLTNFVSAP